MGRGRLLFKHFGHLPPEHQQAHTGVRFEQPDVDAVGAAEDAHAAALDVDYGPAESLLPGLAADGDLGQAR